MYGWKNGIFCVVVFIHEMLCNNINDVPLVGGFFHLNLHFNASSMSIKLYLFDIPFKNLIYLVIKN
jgi:hypothetical protein